MAIAFSLRCWCHWLIIFDISATMLAGFSPHIDILITHIIAIFIILILAITPLYYTALIIDTTRLHVIDITHYAFH